MLARANARSALPPSGCQGFFLARRTEAEWAIRILFALCCAIVVLMAVHGDERGRRPRFVWQSFENTIKVVKLQTIGDRTGSAADVAPAAVALVAAVMPLASPPSPVRKWVAATKNQAIKAAYLLPFGNGPPPSV